MNSLVVIAILAGTILLLYKGTKGNHDKVPMQTASRVLLAKIGLYIASQTAIMILLFVLRGTGKSLANGAFHSLIVILIIIAGSVIILFLHRKHASAKSWVLLYSIASVLNVLIWETTKAIPE